MPKGRRVLDSLSQAVEGPPRRFDGGVIEKLEERLSVTSRNCRLYHCSDPLIGNLGKRDASVREARKSARKSSIGWWEVSIQTGGSGGFSRVESYHRRPRGPRGKTP